MKSGYVGALVYIEKYVGFMGILFKVIKNCGVFEMIFMFIFSMKRCYKDFWIT